MTITPPAEPRIETGFVVEPGPVVESGPTRRRRRIRVSFGLALSLLVIAVALAAALAPGLFTSKDPYEIFVGHHLQPPSWKHPFGTDNLSRDLFARVVYGTRVTLLAALLALAISIIVGTVLGLLAGFFGGWVSTIIMRLTDLMLSIPSLMMSLAIVAALGFGTRNVAIAVGIAGIAPVTRLMRSTVMIVARSDYVEAAVLSGVSRPRILARHVLPNAFSPVAAYAALDFGAGIIAIASLSFLGLGVAPPHPEWGSLVAEGRGYLSTAWWLTTLPGLVITAVVVAANGVYLYFRSRTRVET